MNVHVVSYDLNQPGQVYPRIVGRLKALGAQRVQHSQWMLRTSQTASQLRDDLLSYIDNNDRLLVADVTNAPMAWHYLEIQIKPAFNLT